MAISKIRQAGVFLAAATILTGTYLLLSSLSVDEVRAEKKLELKTLLLVKPT